MTTTTNNENSNGDAAEKGNTWKLDVADKLKVAVGLFVLLALVGLVTLGWLGWTELQTAVELESVVRATSETTPAQDSDTCEAAIPDTDTPAASPDATQSPAPTQGDQETAALTSRASQHFLTLVALGSIAVLFPGLLLLAFAFQQVPRLEESLEGDLEKLGFETGKTRKVRREEAEKIESLVERERRPVERTRRVASELRGMRSAADMLLNANRAAMPSLVSSLLPHANEETRREVVKEAERGIEKMRIGREEDLGHQLQSRYGWLEFLFPLLSVTLFALVMVVWAFFPQGIHGFVDQIAKADGASLHIYFSAIVAGMSPALIAMLVAYLFMAHGLVRRYHRSDITPGSYWEVMKRLFVVLLLGLVITALIKADPEKVSVAGVLAIVIGIFAGVFPSQLLAMLAREGQGRLQLWLQSGSQSQADGKNDQGREARAQRLRPRHDITLLDDIDQWDALRIEEEGVIGIQGVATADMTHLVTWLPFPTLQIVDWVDQAILRLAAGAEPDRSYVKTLRAMGLRGASDLLDAASDEKGRRTLVLAAKAVRSTPSRDPIPLAHVAALRAQIGVKDAQEKIEKARRETEGAQDPVKGIGGDIESAVGAVRDAKASVDDALEKVEAGGHPLKGALDAATTLQTTLEAASERADKVEEALNAVEAESVSQALKDALEDLEESTSKASSQAQNLADTTERIASPLVETVSKASSLREKAIEIRKKAEDGRQAEVPKEVHDAKTLHAELSGLAKDDQRRIQADPSLECAVGKVDKLVNLLTDDGALALEKLLGEGGLEREERWTAAVADDDKAEAHKDAQELVTYAENILSTAEDGQEAVARARAIAAASAGEEPILTLEVLETMLRGLERNPNLRRIQRYLTKAASEVAPPRREYVDNARWLLEPTTASRTSPD